MIQVMENLVGNAIKYSDSGTAITLRLKTSEYETRIEVQDEGPGISASELEKLFREYSTISSKTTGGEKSTGLGLSIAKKYVEAMKGKIGVESKQGRGSTFFISFSKVLTAVS